MIVEKDMKVTIYCYECLKGLAYQAAGLATDDENVRSQAVAEGLSVLDDNFSLDEVSIVVATKIHRAIREITRNPDPYREMKEKEIAISKGLGLGAALEFGKGFRDCLKVAARGNTIDFFRPLDAIAEDMKSPVEFAIDDSGQFEEKLARARRVLYLADNAGELLFDLPLVKWMRQRARVIYVVKASPVQNDVTLEDVRRAGIEADLGEVMTTGTDTPGIDLSMASAEFIAEFESADLILAKGMGYYESLSELPADGRILYCLMAKCQPVADALGISLGSYVAAIQ